MTPDHPKPPLTLLRALGPHIATAIVVGTVIGSGVFKNPQRIAAAVPDFSTVALVWIVGGLLTFLGALALAEVAVLFPQAGGNYVYLREGFGRLFGFLWGWVEFWIIRAASLAALATIFTESLHDICRSLRGYAHGQMMFSFWQERMLTLAVLMTLALVNMRGVRWGGGLQFFITLVKVVSLLAILALPVVLWGQFDAPETMHSQTGQFSWTGLGTAFLAVLWPYHGWMNVAPIAGEVKQPQRNIPIAFLAGTSIIIFLYLGANLAYHLVIPHDTLANLQGTTVVSYFSQSLLGPVGAILASSVVMISVFGALNGNILVGPRLLYAMGQDGMAPRVLSKLHATYRTPIPAIALLTGWSCALILIGGWMMQREFPALEIGGVTLDVNLPERKQLFDLLTDFAMFGAVIFETLAVSTIFVFRNRFPDLKRSYRCPLYPWVPLLYLVVPAYVLVNMFFEQRAETVIGLSFIALGVVVYALFCRARQPDRGDQGR